MYRAKIRRLLQQIRQRLLRKDHFVSKPIPRSKLHDVTQVPTSLSLDHFAILADIPAWMTHAERLLLFSLVFSLRPHRYLEIGTFQGGSALVVARAMDAANIDGKLICVDPAPKISDENWRKLEARVTLLTGSSPQILPEAASRADGKFDLILIDGDHSYDGVMRDATGVLSFAEQGGHILFHDCFSSDVQIAIDYFVMTHQDRVVDLGALTRETTQMVSSTGDVSYWGGLRMLKVR